MLNSLRNTATHSSPVYSTARSNQIAHREKGFFYGLLRFGKQLQRRISVQSVDIDNDITNDISNDVDNTKNDTADILKALEAIDIAADGESLQFDQSILMSVAGSAIDSAIDADTANVNQADKEVQLEDGLLLHQQGDLDGAIAGYRQFIQLHPTDTAAYQYLAEALTQQGNLEEAAFCYRQAIQFAELTARETNQAFQESAPEPEPEQTQQENAVDCIDEDDEAAEGIESEDIPWFEQASFHLQQAAVNCNTGDWEAAIASAEFALTQLQPAAAAAYLILGRSLQGQRHFTAAEQAYQKVLMLQPNAEAEARLGSLYVEQRQFTQAINHYQAAIQLDPNFAGAYWKLAEIWQQLEQEAAAANCFYQALQLQPTWANAAQYCNLADRLLKLGQLELAQTCYRQALHLDPHLAEVYLGLGRVLSQQGEPILAVDCYRRAMRQDSTNQQLYLQLAEDLSQLNHWQDALICYQNLVQFAPGQLAGITGLQQCCIQLERWQDALDYSRQLVEQQPELAQNWHQMGDVLSRLEDWSEAITAYQQAITRDPHFSWSHNNLGDALLRLEQWQAAAISFQTAIALNPTFVWSHFNLGEALFQLEQWDEAIASYRAALQLQPDLPHATTRLADALQQRAVSDQTKALAFYQQAIQQAPLNPDPYHKALELCPDSIELYLGLMEALIDRERWDEALICGQIVRQLQPEDAAIIDRLKYILQQRQLARQPRSDNAAAYQQWQQQHTPTPADLRQMAIRAKTLAYQPLISILMPVYNSDADFLKAAIVSVLNQVYQHWELCIADDASDETTRAILNKYAAEDVRIKIVFRSQNGHISAASNSALAIASGDYIALLDHDDMLAPEALYEVVSLLNQHPEADMIYSDEDKLDAAGKRIDPFFKPDWCPDSFLSRMYTCHLGVYRRRLVEQIGGFRSGYEGSQDYDLVLRLTEQTNQIFHLPKVLYHWRCHAASTASDSTAKSYAADAAKQALLDACQRRGEPVRAIETDPDTPDVHIIRYQIKEYKPVSIIIPTRNLGLVLNRCLQSIFQQSTYPNYEVILIDNGSDEVETLDVINYWQQQEPDRFKCHTLDIPFNYSKINNSAVLKANGDYLLFLNNDVEVITPDWIEAMVEQVQRPSIGAVGALLFYPNQTIQHAGVVLGLGGVAGHSHKHYPRSDRGYFFQLISVNNYSAVTAACLMCRRSVFEQVNGFDEVLAVAFNDVDFCLKIKQLGYQNIYLPHVKLYHHESKSRGIEDTPAKQRRFHQEIQIMQQKWKDFLLQDPCYNPHLTLDREDYSIG